MSVVNRGGSEVAREFAPRVAVLETDSKCTRHFEAELDFLDDDSDDFFQGVRLRCRRRPGSSMSTCFFSIRSRLRILVSLAFVAFGSSTPTLIVCVDEAVGAATARMRSSVLNARNFRHLASEFESPEEHTGQTYWARIPTSHGHHNGLK